MTRDRFKNTGKPLTGGATPGSFSPTELPESGKSLTDDGIEYTPAPYTADGSIDVDALVEQGIVHRFSTTPFPDGPRTMSFHGHWDNDEIVVESTFIGEVSDDRDDEGYWEQGLWAETATGVSEADIAAKIWAGSDVSTDGIRMAFGEDDYTPETEAEAAEAKAHLPLDPEGQVDTDAAIERGIIVGFSTKRYDDGAQVKSIIGRFDGHDFVVEKIVDGGAGFNRRHEDDPYGYPGFGMSDADVVASVLDDEPFAHVIMKDAND